MVATTLLLTLVSLGTAPVHQDRTPVALSRPASTVAHLAVPTGIAVPMQRAVALAVSDLFKSPVQTDMTPAVAEERLPDRRARSETGVTDPAYRPSGSL